MANNAHFYFVMQESTFLPLLIAPTYDKIVTDMRNHLRANAPGISLCRLQ